MAAKKSAAPTPTPSVEPPQAVPALRVSSARDGFRRGGRAWSWQPTLVPVADFTPEQLAQIRAEPMLKVEDIMLPVED